MNFWEAREAALNGKRVRRTMTNVEYTPKQMLNPEYAWFQIHFNENWEVIEEPKTTTKYLNVYPTHYGDWDIHSSAEDAHYHAHSNALLGTIEITVDENGKFIKGENV